MKKNNFFIFVIGILFTVIKSSYITTSLDQSTVQSQNESLARRTFKTWQTKRIKEWLQIRSTYQHSYIEKNSEEIEEMFLKNSKEIYSYIFEETKYYCKKFYDYMTEKLDSLTNKYNKYDTYTVLIEDLLSYNKGPVDNLHNIFEKIPFLKKEMIEEIRYCLKKIDIFCQLIEKVPYENHKNFLVNLENALFFEEIFNLFFKTDENLQDIMMAIKESIFPIYIYIAKNFITKEIEQKTKNKTAIRKIIEKEIENNKIINTTLFNKIEMHYKCTIWHEKNQYILLAVKIKLKLKDKEFPKNFINHSDKLWFYINTENGRVYDNERDAYLCKKNLNR